MLRGWIKRGWQDERAAVAPTVALTLFGLIAAGGLAFDYARMVALDTELQNAADQAALAAASQLDGVAASGLEIGARARATNAASNLVHNLAVFANDGNAFAVTIQSVSFCSAFNDAVGDTTAACTATALDTNAKVAWVKVAPRQAVYALTPVVALFNSGNLSAEAVAGLGTAICKVPPVMICNPQETAGSTSFNASALVGKGLKLVTVGSGGGTWAPGNFGYLNTNGGNGTPGIRQALGWETPPGDCVSNTNIDTKPGASVSVTDALNTRFDIYDNGVGAGCPSGGNCPPSINSTKDLVRAPGNNAASCTLGSSGWQEASSTYLPTTNQTLAAQGQALPLAMGHPRDICHAITSGTTGACTGTVGNGIWDRDAYFAVNYGWTTASAWQSNTSTAINPLPSNPTRYEVYNWEILHRGETIGGRVVLDQRTVTSSGTGNGGTGNGKGNGNASSGGSSGPTLSAYGSPVCGPIAGYGTGTVPGSNTVDRRRLSVAVINCLANGVNGNSTNVPVETWVDVFLVEPSINRAGSRTSNGDIYVEVIEEATAGASGSTTSQVVRRDMPFLIR